MQKSGNAQGGERKTNEPDGWIAYCEECGKAFGSNAAIKVPYREYPGTSLSYEEVSPCCGTGYNDAPRKELSQ